MGTNRADAKRREAGRACADPAVAERFRVTLELHEAGVEMMKLNLRRRFPGASEAELAEHLRGWLQPPLLPFVDHHVVPWPRR